MSATAADSSGFAPPRPIPDPDSQGFWEASARGELVIRRCQECGYWHQPPREHCRRCGGPTAFEPVSGHGLLHSFIVVHQRAIPGLHDQVPYAIGLVELAEQPGLRITGRVLTDDPSSLEVDSPVTATFAPIPGTEWQAPCFEVASGDAG